VVAVRREKVVREAKPNQAAPSFLTYQFIYDLKGLSSQFEIGLKWHGSSENDQEKHL
jgi:hypothetical protein